MTAQKKYKKKDDKGFFESYAKFSKILRTWLVAYGIGAPVLFANNDCVIKVIQDTKNGPYIVKLFLIGVSIQVFAALIYKYAMGYLYFGELDKYLKNKLIYKIADYLSESMWLEMIFDLSSIGCFLFATYRVYTLIF